MFNSVSGDQASLIANADKKTGPYDTYSRRSIKICCMIDDAHYMHTFSRFKVYHATETKEANRMLS